MRDFSWTEELWCVVNDNGTYAGRPCLTLEEALDLAAQDQSRAIFKLLLFRSGINTNYHVPHKED